MRDVLLVEDFQPRSELVVPAHPVERARVPAIDAHNHLTHKGWAGVDPAETVRAMDFINVRAIVNLSGGFGDALQRNLDALDRAYPGRFVTFCNVPWEGLGSPGWTERAVTQLRTDIAAGARGLKIFKELGLRIRDVAGNLVMPDDPRLSDLWDAAGELGVPVLIHTADPVAFFRPLDRFNERWDELHEHPDWHFYGPEFPSFGELMEHLYGLIEGHPRTTFITAHVGCYPENLGFVSQMLDQYPNMYTDFSARIAELGRAPYSARRWFLKYSERILFGTDITPRIPMYQTHFRFLETEDEYFDYEAGTAIPGQGRWRIYGLNLPADVLQRIYHDNAARLLKM